MLVYQRVPWLWKNRWWLEYRFGVPPWLWKAPKEAALVATLTCFNQSRKYCNLFESSQVNLLDMLRKSHLRLAQTVHSDLGLWKTHPLEAFRKWHPWQLFSWSCSAPAWQPAWVTLSTQRCHWWMMRWKLGGRGWRRNQRNSSGMLQAWFSLEFFQIVK